MRISVQQQASNHVFIADYTGDPRRHDVLVRFAVGGGAYNVDGELYEDGTGVAQLQDLSAGDAIVLDPGQVVRSGRVELVVGDRLIADLAGESFDVVVSLTVDGSPVETC